MINNKAILLILILLSIAATGCANRREGQEGPPPATDPAEAADQAGPTTTPERQVGVTILVDGAIKPVQPSLPLSFATAGRLLTVEVSPGESVETGDLIATLDDTSSLELVASAEAALAVVEAQLAQAKAPPDPATVASAESQVAQAEAGLAAAQANRSGLFSSQDQAAIIEAEAAVADAQVQWDAARRAHEQLILRERFGATEEQARLQAEAAFRTLEAAEARLDQLQAGPTAASIQAADAEIARAEATLDNAEKQLALLKEGPALEDIAVLQAQVAQAQLNLEQAQGDLADSRLLAPWPGTVLSIEVAVGALVASGTPIVTLLDTRQLEFHTTNLSERDLAQIQPGQRVIVTLKAFPDDPIEGTVERISPQAEGEVGDAAAFPLIINLGETDLDLRSGMTGRAETGG